MRSIRELNWSSKLPILRSTLCSMRSILCSMRSIRAFILASIQPNPPSISTMQALRAYIHLRM